MAKEKSKISKAASLGGNNKSTHPKISMDGHGSGHKKIDRLKPSTAAPGKAQAADDDGDYDAGY